jgi:enoyl-CoA hydratase
VVSQATLETIRWEVDAAGVALLTFDRPETRNALSLQMVREVHAALQDLSLRGDVKCLIFTGAGGKAFISGADIAELRDRGRQDALARINTGLFRAVEQFPAPTIAAVRGFALGGGCELCLACDLRVAGEGSRFGQPEVGLGILPGAGATYRLPRLVGLGAARELIFTGRIIDAKEALSIGLVNRVVKDDEVLDAARALAAEIGKNSALAVRLAKQSLALSQELSTDGAMALEATAQAVLFEDEEKRRRMTEFLEKKGGKPTPRTVAMVGLELAGLVDAATKLGYEELRALPDEDQVADVSTLVPGRKGRAVKLSALLARARPGRGAAHVAVRSADGSFEATQPLDAVREALVVYALADGPLPKEQGGPFRLLIPGCPDPCANVKDVAKVELRAAPGANTCPHSPDEHAKMKVKGP